MKKKIKRIYLTKNRKKALNLALSIDDILYEQMKRLSENLNKDIRKWHRKRQVIKVIKDGKIPEILLITKEIKTPDGIIIKVSGQPTQ